MLEFIPMDRNRNGLIRYDAFNSDREGFITIFGYAEDVDKIREGVDIRDAMPYLCEEQYVFLGG